MMATVWIVAAIVACVAGVRAYRREVARRRLGRLARELGVQTLPGESTESLERRVAARSRITLAGRR